VGYIEGQGAVSFLMNSNLSRDVLKVLWSLATSSGSLTRNQFYVLLRLISIAVNPLFAGVTPTAQLYIDTLSNDISLPMMEPLSSPSISVSSSLAFDNSNTLIGNGVSTMQPPASAAISSSHVYQKGERALYMGTEIVTVVDKHLDDFPNVYYTIRLPTGSEKQVLVNPSTTLRIRTLIRTFPQTLTGRIGINKQTVPDKLSLIGVDSRELSQAALGVIGVCTDNT
jgi:hypothetical protein